MGGVISPTLQPKASSLSDLIDFQTVQSALLETLLPLSKNLAQKQAPLPCLALSFLMTTENSLHVPCVEWEWHWNLCMPVKCLSNQTRYSVSLRCFLLFALLPWNAPVVINLGWGIVKGWLIFLSSYTDSPGCITWYFTLLLLLYCHLGDIRIWIWHSLAWCTAFIYSRTSQINCLFIKQCWIHPLLGF